MALRSVGALLAGVVLLVIPMLPSGALGGEGFASLKGGVHNAGFTSRHFGAGASSRHLNARVSGASQADRLAAFTAERRLEAGIQLRALLRDGARYERERQLARSGSLAGLKRYLYDAEWEERLEVLAIRSRLDRDLWVGAADLPWLKSADRIARARVDSSLLLWRLRRDADLRARGTRVRSAIEERAARRVLTVDDFLKPQP